LAYFANLPCVWRLAVKPVQVVPQMLVRIGRGQERWTVVEIVGGTAKLRGSDTRVRYRPVEELRAVKR